MDDAQATRVLEQVTSLMSARVPDLVRASMTERREREALVLRKLEALKRDQFSGAVVIVAGHTEDRDLIDLITRIRMGVSYQCVFERFIPEETVSFIRGLNMRPSSAIVILKTLDRLDLEDKSHVSRMTLFTCSVHMNSEVRTWAADSPLVWGLSDSFLWSNQVDAQSLQHGVTTGVLTGGCIYYDYITVRLPAVVYYSDVD
jgi:hypothetical protein